MKQKTLEESAQREDVDRKYEEMDELFQEHGMEDSKEIESGEAIVCDYRAKKYPFKTDPETAVDLVIYFRLPTTTEGEEYGKICGTFGTQNVDSKIQHFTSQLPQNNLSNLLGISVPVSYTDTSSWDEDEEFTWKMDTTGMTIEESEEPTGPNSKWDHQTTSQERFDSVLEARSNIDPERMGDGRIVDFYVQESASNMSQSLEIGLCFITPENTITWYECLHDSDNPDKTLENIMEFVGAEEVRDLQAETIPMVYTGDHPEDKSWFIYPKGRTVFGSLLQKIGMWSPSKIPDRYLIKPQKTYTHSRDSDKNTRLKRSIEREIRPL